MQSKVTTYDKIKPLFFNGMKLLYGGFGGVGTPPGLVDCLIEKVNLFYTEQTVWKLNVDKYLDAREKFKQRNDRS